MDFTWRHPNHPAHVCKSWQLHVKQSLGANFPALDENHVLERLEETTVAGVSHTWSHPIRSPPLDLCPTAGWPSPQLRILHVWCSQILLALRDCAHLWKKVPQIFKFCKNYHRTSMGNSLDKSIWKKCWSKLPWNFLWSRLHRPQQSQCFQSPEAGQHKNFEMLGQLLQTTKHRQL